MARTRPSTELQRIYQRQADRQNRRLDRARLGAGTGILLSAATVVDDLAHGAITKSYDNVLLDHLGLHISTANLQATRLPVAAVFAVGALMNSIHALRHQNRINTLEKQASEEEQSDRLATAIELGSGQRFVENAIFEPGEQTPIFAQHQNEHI